MNRIEAVHDDKEDELKTENGWGWWIVLPVVALGLIAYQLAEASMTSIFDEDE